MSQTKLIKSKYEVFGLYVLFVILVIAYGLNFSNGDYNVYKSYYLTKHPHQWGIEVGYGLVMYLSRELQVPFEFYYLTQAILSVFLLFKSILKNSRNPFFVALVFTIFYFPLDYVLSRSFLAFTIFLQGIDLRNWAQGRENKKMLGYIFLSSLFHMSMLAYLLIFPLYMAKVSKKTVLTFVLGCVLVGVVLFFIRDTGFFNARISIYRGSFYSFLFDTTLILLNFLFVLYASKCITEEYIKTKLVKINFSQIFLLLLICMIPTFIRVFRHISFINILILFNYIKFNGSRVHLISLVGLGVKFVFLYLYFIYPYNELTLFSLRFNYLGSILELFK